ncbi:MAG: ATP-dependent zinc metalloprotease FtsH [Sphaerochaeta sp.]|jgi:cell division protease FtsH|nr:ATP-dependent zinc metalloprotease FtsH [Sphaerochaeta sp.]MCH3920101.1 ATP-dependent zinc metalloprotease FtsH [Sphaerochaeta sp.]MCI2045654.1 ATP-dependent zinc metalloprotease FtsH [Sphaerochaeta sp.]MCI2096288.1 ATP-dependent zinc metalloprotease FtsH [Sphaerochaeta sp.]MCI2104175.1 ATP-dependent zinc metalloprotease FtsH [Sphaerochaeta sp.]
MENNQQNLSEFEKDQQHHKQPKEEPGIHLGGPDPNKRKKFTFSFWYFFIFLMLLYLINSMALQNASRRAITKIDYNQFKSLVESGTIKRVEITDEQYIGYTITKEQAQTSLQSKDTESIQDARAYSTYIVQNDSAFIPLLDSKGVEYYATAPQKPGIVSTILSYVLPFIFLIIIWRIIFSKMGGAEQGVLSFNQNKAKIVAEGDTGVRFSDVAGVDESKQELEEVVDFLKNPQRYTAMGAKIPKGVLLVGPPGTGKTLLAKAVAGEAGVPFFKMSGADFVEMFVGVGAARVRDLFKQARENSPCIIFIDEIDAIGRQRSAASIGGNDEREQTLNQLLVEMDGFDSRTGVIILAATNRPEILDPALLRPGRFDRQVLVDKPDLEGRFQILQIHTRGMKLGPDVDLHKIAQASVGLSGADLANIANEAALMAVREKREQIAQVDFEEAIEKSVAGLERKSRVMNPEERKRVAYHETGHALTAFMTKGAEPVSKISIVPRGMGALGYTLQYPTEDRFLLSQSELLGSIDTMLGGRAAEEVTFHEISTGASNDISRASDLARRMITEFGMSEKFRNITLPKTDSGIQGVGGSREYSEDTQKYIDNETARIINERYAVVKDHLEKNKKALSDIAELLLKQEVVEGNQFEEIAKKEVVLA